MTDTSRTQLIEELEKYLTGDSRRFDTLRMQLGRYVALRFSASPDEIRDLVSEIMAVALASLRTGQFRGDSVKAFNAFLYGIARLKILQAVDRAGRLSELSLHMRSGDFPVGRITDPDTRVTRGDLLKKIYDELGDPCRELVRLKFTYGWTDQEIANHKHMTRNAVSTALSRCLKKVRGLQIIRELLYQSGEKSD